MVHPQHTENSLSALPTDQSNTKHAPCFPCRRIGIAAPTMFVIIIIIIVFITLSHADHLWMMRIQRHRVYTVCMLKETSSALNIKASVYQRMSIHFQQKLQIMERLGTEDPVVWDPMFGWPNVWVPHLKVRERVQISAKGAQSADRVDPAWNIPSFDQNCVSSTLTRRKPETQN